MPYTIAPVTEAHFTGLHRAIDIVARERQYLAFTQAPPLEQSIAFYRSLLDRNFPQFVALENDIVVGWCDVSPLHGESRAHIGTLGIGLIPEARHKGLGAQLLQAALQKAWAIGLTRIELSVRTDNHNAKALYERFGFEVEGVKRNANLIEGRYYDAFAMACLRRQ